MENESQNIFTLISSADYIELNAGETKLFNTTDDIFIFVELGNICINFKNNVSNDNRDLMLKTSKIAFFHSSGIFEITAADIVSKFVIIKFKLFQNIKYKNIATSLNSMIDLPYVSVLKKSSAERKIINCICTELIDKKAHYMVKVQSIFCLFVVELITNRLILISTINDIIMMIDVDDPYFSKISYVSNDKTTATVNVSNNIQEVVNYIVKNFAQKISLQSIAKELHYNVNHLSTMFNRELGTTFSQFLCDIRLAIARKMLLETDYSIEKIALEVGFYDVQHFLKKFKLSFGTTPTNYRKTKG